MISAVLAIPVLLIIVGLARIFNLRKGNELKKRAVLEALGVTERDKKRLVGFFHPYW